MIHEIEGMLGQKNIVRVIKATRISWYRHINRRERIDALNGTNHIKYPGIEKIADGRTR